MENIAPKTTLLDVEYLGNPKVIAACLIEGEGSVALVDPGPTSALPTLRKKLDQLGLGVAGLDTILLTHIHLDHAGATGTLVRENPRIRVYVHERGAPHMVNPSRLLESAQRLYGTEMDRLWGEFIPVPLANISALHLLRHADRNGLRRRHLRHSDREWADHPAHHAAARY